MSNAEAPKVFGTDPTEGFTQYVQSIKPYHTKILEVLVEYIYTEHISVKVAERYNWNIALSNYNIEAISNCGFGIVWDSWVTTNDYHPVKIIQAVGNTPTGVEFLVDPLTPTKITITHNPDGYVVSVGDPITFRVKDTTAVSPNTPFPNTTVGHISPGLVYYVTSVQNNQIEIARTSLVGSNSGIVSFTSTGIGTFELHRENLQYNTFLIECPPTTVYQCQATNIRANQFTFINAYNIIGVDHVTQQWTISGLVTETMALPDGILFIHNNGGNGADGQYTIQSSTVVGGNTIITVLESISVLSQSNGTLSIADDTTLIPNWVAGTKVKLTTVVSATTGKLPAPLSTEEDYYFIQTNYPGIFNLSKKRYPLSDTDIINLADFGVGIIDIRRAEPVYPGAVVDISSTHLSRNDGIYYIDKVKQEGSNFRITTLQSVNRTTPPTMEADGILMLDILSGYDTPMYCYNLEQADDLYTNAFVDERITFEFIINLTDEIKPMLVENNSRSYGASLSVSIPTSYTLVPMGLDAQCFDVGAFDESIRIESQLNH